ncbi:MAG: HEAT repeat domain-containing protein [Verrucomicrobia bacterium]|nr:HEAT repeat domain-containing protein [Verrucomicrobiota bacterium]
MHWPPRWAAFFALVRVEATYTTWRIDPANARCGIELLQEFAQSTTEAKLRTGEHLARSALAMHLRAAETVPLMLATFDEVDPSLRAQAAKTLAQFKSDALPALPKLTFALRDPDRGLRAAAVSAIEAIGPAAAEAIPNLVDALGDPAAQAVAARALGEFGPAAAAAVPKLVELVSDPSRFAGSAELRSNAARALGRIGVTDESVLAALRQAGADPDATIREAAREALTRLDAAGGQP